MPGIRRVVAPVAMIRLSQVYDCSVLPSLTFTSMHFGPVSVPHPLISVILFFFIRKWTPLTMPALTCRDRACVGPNAIVALPSMPNLSFSWVSVCASSAFAGAPSTGCTRR